MKSTCNYLIIFVLMLSSYSLSAQVKLETDKQKFSYAVGVQLGQNIANQGIEIDNDSLLSGIADIINKQALKLTGPEMQAAAGRHQAKEEQRYKVMGEQNKAAGEKFLAENKARDGVTELVSGLQYIVLAEGTGASPKATDTVVVHYRGTLIDGTEFDSSYGRGEPVAIPVNGVIQGWQEALPLMKVGSKWQIFVPSDLGYGENAAGAEIGPHSTLIFDIELLSINQ